MSSRRSVSLLIAAALLRLSLAKAAAQISPCEMQLSAAPIYPAIAKAAHVEGDVLLLGSFDHDGLLLELKLISGPVMLQEVTRKAVSTWQAKPFTGPRTCPLVVHYRLQPFDPKRPAQPSQTGPGHLTVTAQYIIID